MRKVSYQAGIFIGTILILGLLLGMSIVYGYTDTSWGLAYEAFISSNNTKEHIVIESIRLPRALIAAVVGSSLAIAGLLMQTLTKNPLASPGIFGINAGAGFMVVAAVTLFGVTDLQAFSWISFLGAGIAAVGVYAIGSAGREGLTPMKLTLAGAAITALFASFTQGLLVLNEAALEQVLFWLAGSVQGRNLEILGSVFPYILFGWILALVIANKMNVIAMGEDVAKGLGLKTGLIKFLALSIVVLLAGGAVAIAGPIGFIGIVIPHIAKKIIGIDHRWLIPYSGLLGAILLLAADIGARYIIMPQEVPVGVMTAAIGAPFFIYIARRGF
ncbi:FecCD family ABC transporter permease [Rossellomorea sp. BNER]|uniref:FecCD family ABC transporter permease n=1 Tax=Rossellomorea sp. BNER TaxID=2962031 RepID=UPI003AF230F0|nr:iron ABC transporter permease [Rossellomorea sp. BNER]